MQISKALRRPVPDEVFTVLNCPRLGELTANLLLTRTLAMKSEKVNDPEREADTDKRSFLINPRREAEHQQPAASQVPRRGSPPCIQRSRRPFGQRKPQVRPGGGEAGRPAEASPADAP